jgi:hypothetical protein
MKVGHRASRRRELTTDLPPIIATISAVTAVDRATRLSVTGRPGQLANELGEIVDALEKT